MSRSIGTGRSMSALTSSMAPSWSGVSTYGKASSSSRCQGVSWPNAWPADAIRAEYRRISSAAICRTALRARPLVFAQSAPGRRLPADVPRDLVQLVGGHVQPVRRLSALAGRVLDDQVLPDRPLHAAAGHLQVAAHAVL